MPSLSSDSSVSLPLLMSSGIDSRLYVCKTSCGKIRRSTVVYAVRRCSRDRPSSDCLSVAADPQVQAGSDVLPTQSSCVPAEHTVAPLRLFVHLSPHFLALPALLPSNLTPKILRLQASHRNPRPPRLIRPLLLTRQGYPPRLCRIPRCGIRHTDR